MLIQGCAGGSLNGDPIAGGAFLKPDMLAVYIIHLEKRRSFTITIKGGSAGSAAHLKQWRAENKKSGDFAMSRILIADDHAVVRAGYRQFLEADPAITEVGEAASGNETLDALRRKKWDLLLMDIHMPDRGGLDILKHVSQAYEELRVLVVSGLPEEQYARNVLRAGASGYLSKGGSPQELLKAVRLVLSGRRYISASLAESMAADLENRRDQNIPLHTTLSTREFQIFCKLALGMTVNRIGAELSLSVKTVSTYRTRILTKMAFKSNAEIVGYALKNGLIQ